MYKIEVEGFDPYEIKTKMTEFTLKEFQDMSKLINDTNLDQIDKYLKILELLGTPDDILDNIESEQFIEVIKELNINSIHNKDLTRTINIDTYEYEAYLEDKEFSFKAKDLSLIETFVKKNPDKFLLYALAVIFKRTDLTRKEHYTDAHIKHKMKLFGDLNADLYYPYIVAIHNKITEKLDNVKESITEEITEKLD